MLRVALTAGHNRYKMQGVWYRGTSENEFWNKFIAELIPLAEKLDNIKVKQFHRPRQKKIGYYRAMDKQHRDIDRWGADVDIELHFNAFNHKVTGHEVLHYRGSSGGRYFARRLSNSFIRYLPNQSRGLKPISYGERGSYGLKIGKSYSLISEPFFKHKLMDYMPNGKYREELLNSYLDFLSQL